MNKAFIAFLALITVVCFTNANILTNKINTTNYIETMEKFDIEGDFLKDKLLLLKLDKLDKKKNFLKNMNKAYLFIPLLRKKIKAAGIPEEFLYLAMAESNFSPHAYSPKKAAGLWQFMPRTGRKYNLRIDNYVDERRDILKSTDAAILFLQDLHKRFGKWYLAAMAYNCGAGRVRWAIKKAKSDKLKDLLRTKRYRKKQYLPAETRNYIRKILAFAFMVKESNFFTDNKNSHIFNMGLSNPIVTIDVPANTHLSDIANVLNMRYSDLRKINNHLRYNITPPNVKKYQIYIPYSRLALFSSNKNLIKPSSSGLRIHIVRKGDSLYSLARAFGVSVGMLKMTNNLKSNNLRLNKKLIVPVAGKYLGNKSRRNKIIYKIKSGDTLSRISHKFNIKIKELVRQNNLTNNNIKVGRKLVIYN